MAKTPGYTFSDKLDYDHLPPLLRTVYDSMGDAVSRDKMLLGVLTLISGMLPDSYYGCYDRRRVYAIIGNTDKDPFKTPHAMPAELERLYQLLPPADREFTLAETVQKGLTLGFSERSTRRMLGRLVSQFGLVMHPRYGVYQKTSRKEVEEA